MRFFFSGLLCLAALGAVLYLSGRYPLQLDPSTYAYVIRNYFEDTGSRNAVSAILLNYRMYDTVFEALILFSAIVGMHQFLPHRTEDSDDKGA